MHNTNHNSGLINSLLLCAQAALLGGTVSNHDVINVLDIAQDLVLLTINDSTICSLSSTQDMSTPLHTTSNWLVNLRTQRETCGLTTAELARLLDLDEEIIIQWESGEYEPTISMLIPLANVLGCDPMWLLTGEVTPPEQPKSEEQQHHDASQQVCSLSREALLRKNQYQW